MEINERQIKLQKSQLETPKDYQLGEEIEFKVIGTVINIVDKDNNDGTKNIDFVVKPILTDVIND